MNKIHRARGELILQKTPPITIIAITIYIIAINRLLISEITYRLDPHQSCLLLTSKEGTGTAGFGQMPEGCAEGFMVWCILMLHKLGDFMRTCMTDLWLRRYLLCI